MTKLETVTLFIIVICVLVSFIPEAAMAHSWKAPKEASTKQNPVEKSEQSINSGMKLYNQFCAGCHGRSAKGDGEIIPPDLEKRAKHHSDGDFFWKIQHGRGEMPSFKDELQEKEIWDIINYIKMLAGKKY